MSVFILTQAFLYDKGGHQSTNARWVIFLLTFEWLVIISVFIVEIGLYKKLPNGEEKGPDYFTVNWSTIRMCGYGKALISLFKYMP